MKTSLQRLPASKQEDLALITEVIKERVKPEMIILVGSHARGNWIDDTYREPGVTFQYKSDYDILVVTEKPSDAPWLIARVEVLQELTEKICIEKIENPKKGE
mgnify:FL=1